MKKHFTLILISTCFYGSSFAVTHTIKTVGATFDPDTTYANIGDTIKFIVGIGHDNREITQAGYVGNTMSLYPGGFSFGSGTFTYVLDSAKTYYFGCSYHMASDQMKGLIIVSDPLATPDFNPTPAVIVYPNPFQNYVSLANLNSIVSLQIYGIDGRVLFEKNSFCFQVETIDLSILSPGIYLLQYKIRDKIFSRKLVKN